MSLREAVEEHWAGQSSRPGLAAGLHLGSLAFRAVTRARNGLYDAGVFPARSAPIPVISVGNLTVGGTGKTPVVRWIVGILREAGHRPAVVLRGYGGDETELHRRWYPNLPVLDAPARLEGVRRAANVGASIAVCDDAFQHRRLARDLDIVLVDALDPRPVQLLPAGPYRELPSALARADVVMVVTKGDEKPRGEDALVRLGAPAVKALHSIGLGTTGWLRLDGTPTAAPSGPLLIATGVGAPSSVEALVRNTSSEDVELLSFPDHHPFTESDVRQILHTAGDRSIVTTEKDAVKLMQWRELQDSTVVLQMGVRSVTDEESLQQRLLGVSRT